MQVKIWILIPTFREVRHISKLLDCLDIQSYKNFQALIINCNPNDETTKFIADKKCDKFIEERRNNAKYFLKKLNLYFFSYGN